MSSDIKLFLVRKVSPSNKDHNACSQLHVLTVALPSHKAEELQRMGLATRTRNTGANH